MIRLILRFSFSVKLIVQQLNISNETVIRNENIKNFYIQRTDSYGHLKCVDVNQIIRQCIFISVSTIYVRCHSAVTETRQFHCNAYISYFCDF